MMGRMCHRWQRHGINCSCNSFAVRVASVIASGGLFDPPQASSASVAHQVAAPGQVGSVCVVCVHTSMCVFACVFVFVCMLICVCVSPYVCVRACVCARMCSVHACFRVFVFVCASCHMDGHRCRLHSFIFLFLFGPIGLVCAWLVVRFRDACLAIVCFPGCWRRVRGPSPVAALATVLVL
jgi:hypothetical protein